jgi:hypothetical protein
MKRNRRRQFLFFVASVCLLPVWRSAASAAEPGPAAGKDDPLKLVTRVYKETRKSLRSAVGEAVYRRYVQRPDDPAPQLWTQARVKVHYDDGKFFLDFAVDKNLVPTVYVDKAGNETRRLADWKMDRFVVVFDGKAATQITFSSRIRPVGCSVSIYDRYFGEPGGFPNDPVRIELWDFERILKNVGKIEFKKLPKGGFRGKYYFKGSKSYAEFDVSPATGNRITEIRLFNPKVKKPVSITKLQWKKTPAGWYVRRMEKSAQYRDAAGKVERRERTVLEYKEFALNVKVDPKLLSADTAVKTPVGTRVFDRRRRR